MNTDLGTVEVTLTAQLSVAFHDFLACGRPDLAVFHQFPTRKRTSDILLCSMHTQEGLPVWPYLVADFKLSEYNKALNETFAYGITLLQQFWKSPSTMMLGLPHSPEMIGLFVYANVFGKGLSIKICDVSISDSKALARLFQTVKAFTSASWARNS